MSGPLWAKSTPAERVAFKDSARAAAAAARRKVDEQDIQWLADLKVAGMLVTALTPDQRAAFAKAVQPAYAQWEKQFGSETIESIRATR
jgi:TRAP-type C4-dicarboxylate transport system substrate-binding protein